MLRSLRSRLIILLALALLPAGSLAIIQALANYDQVKALTERSLLQSAAIVASEEKNEIAAARAALEELASLPAVVEFTPGGCGQALLRLRARSANRYSNLLALRPDGALPRAPGARESVG